MGLIAVAGLLLAFSDGPLIGEIAAADRRADAAVAAIRTPEELKAKQAEWQAAWRAGIGGLPSGGRGQAVAPKSSQGRIRA